MKFLSFSTRKEPGYMSKIFQGNIFLLLPVVLLSCIGFVVLYSAAGGSFEPWASKQIIRFFMGLIILFIVASIDLRTWLDYAYIIYFLSLLLLIVVEIKGHIGMGAQRWIDLKIIKVQPSEIMKISLVLALAKYFHLHTLKQIAKIRNLIIPFMIIAAPTFLVLIQPDLGTAGILFLVGACIFFLAGIPRWMIISAISLGLLCLPILWMFMKDYQKRRVFTFLNPESDPLGAGYHIIQSKIALGAGGFWGKGFMNGSQSQLDFLPEKHTDFIFTMLAEEFGMVGGLSVIFLYTIFIIAGYRIANNSYNQFGRLLSLGIVTTIFFYVSINIAMVMGVFPVVGVPLPLLSYGGTSMLTMLVGCGLILSVSIHKKQKLYRPNVFEDSEEDLYQ